MGGPYAPATAALGGTPSKSLDDPITSVFLVLFILGAATHMTIFQINRRRGKKFIMSAMTFGFCMARIVACTMRLVWSTHLTNIPIAIAASIFVAAGVLILFIVNTIFAQRILRAQHPHFGWKKSISVVFKVLYASIIGGLICIITVTVQSFYTLNPNIRQSDVDVQHVVGIFFAVIAFLPIPLLSLRVILPKKSPTEKFGEGRFSTKIVVLLFTSFILCLGAAFRAGIGFYPRPRNDPAWYHSKACFYIFNFTIEITVVFLYAVIRVDKRFHVPNGSHGPGDYSRDSQKEGYEQEQGLGDRINDEEQVFDSVEQQPEVDVEMQTPEDKSRNRSENTISPPVRSPGVGSTEQILS